MSNILNYQAPVEKFLTYVEREDLKRVLETSVGRVKDQIDSNGDLFAYAVSPVQKRALVEVGVPLHPFPYLNHSHSFSKMLENHILYNIIPSNIDGNWVFSSIKKKKIDVFLQKKKSVSAEVINRLICAKDVSRYCSNNESCLYRKFTKKKPEILPRKFLNLCKNRQVMIHDEVHHWTKEQMFDFLEGSSPKRFLFTIVYPVEVLKGILESQNPEMYTFSIFDSSRGKMIRFNPDGVTSEAYEQQYDLEWLFKSSYLISSKGIWTVKMVYSSYSHHLFEILPGKMFTDEMRVFSNFKTLDLSVISKSRFLINEHIPIRKDLVERVYSYLLCLKKPDVESAMAKLRQILGDDLDVRIQIFFKKLVVRFLDDRKGFNLFDITWSEKFEFMMLDILPKWMVNGLKDWKSKNLFLFLMSLSTLKIEVNCCPCYLQREDEIDSEIAVGIDGQFKEVFGKKYDNVYQLVGDAIQNKESERNFNRRQNHWKTIVKRPLGRGGKDYAFNNVKLDHWTIPLLEIDDETWGRFMAERLTDIFEPCSSFSSNEVGEMSSRMLNQRDRKTKFLWNLVRVFVSSEGDLDECEVYKNKLIADGFFEINDFERKEKFLPFNDWLMKFNAIAFKAPIESSIECNSLSEDADIFKNHGDALLKGDVLRISEPFCEELVSADLDLVEGERRLEPCEQIDTFSDRLDDVPEILPVNRNLTKQTTLIRICNRKNLVINNVPGDGDCFFHCIKALFNLECDVKDLRCEMAQYMSDAGEIEAGVSLLEGIWPDEWMISIFMKRRPELNVCVHPKCIEGVCLTFLDSQTFGCLAKDSDHWYYLSEEEKNEDRENTVASGHDCSGEYQKEREDDVSSELMFSDRLTCEPILNHIQWDPESLQSALKKLPCMKLRGRKAFFFSTDPLIDYSRNGVKYRRLRWIDQIESLRSHIDIEFNTCFIQVFQKGAETPFERYNDKCCDLDPMTILSYGNLKFITDDNISFELKNGDTLTLQGTILSKSKLKIQSMEKDGILIMFRLHKRSMNGSPIPDFIPMIGKNKCLVDCLAKSFEKSREELVFFLARKDSNLIDYLVSDRMASTSEIEAAAKALDCTIKVFDREKEESFFFNQSDEPKVKVVLELFENHLELVEKKRNHSMCGYNEGHCANKGKGDDSDEEEVRREALKLQSFQFLGDYERASVLKKCFLSGVTGVILNDTFNKASRFFNFFPSEEQDGMVLDIGCRVGFPGSGKTFAVCSFLKKLKRGRRFVVCAPRKNLIESWKDKFNQEKEGSFCTFEQLFKKNFSKLSYLVLDELTLFPPGYLDLLSFKIQAENPMLNMIALFDPLQARYDSELDRTHLCFKHDVDVLTQSRVVDYIYSSKRFQTEQMLGLFEGIGNGEERVEFSFYRDELIMKMEKPDIDVVLVASFDEVGLFSNAFNTMTFGQSQGLTFKKVCIVLSESSILTDDHRWFVALSRASDEICFLIKHLNGIAGFLSQVENRMIHSVISKRIVTKRRLNLMLECELNFTEDRVKAGKSDEVDREERLEGDPFLKGFIFLGKRTAIIEPEIIEPVVKKEDMKTHFFHSVENSAMSISFDRIRAKEMREFRRDHMTTNQFVDNYEKIGPHGKRHTAGPLRFESIYPRHRADDDMTFWMAVHKRLRFSNPVKERQKYFDAIRDGVILFENFNSKLGLKFMWDQNLFEECVNDFEVKKLEKSKAMLANHNIRSDVDWDFKSIFLFMKSQLCTKYEKQYCDAKAGQTLACFQHLVLVTFAPYCRYMEKQIRSQLPEEIYIHSNKNFDDLNEWVKRMAYDGESVESDYEAFDASQDQNILAFEVCLMTKMQIPKPIIDAYIELKINLGCKIGQFAIMRFTGEFCTFLFNTLANMAFTFCRYDWKRGQPIAFAGDDMCALSSLKMSDKFENLLSKLSLKAKVQYTKNPMFCGWRLSKHGIVKDPELIFNRFMVAIERGNVYECLENYAIESSYAYSLGERLYEILNDETKFEYHQQVIRFIVKNIDKLKTKVKDLYHEQSDEDLC